MQNRAYSAEGILKVLSVVMSVVSLPLPYYRVINTLLYVITSFLGLIRQKGLPKDISAYSVNLLENDFLWNLIYIAVVYIFDSLKLAFSFPLNLYFILGIADFAQYGEFSHFLKKFDKLKKIFHNLRASKDDFKTARFYCEVLLLPYIIFLITIKKLPYLAVIVYSIFLAAKFKANKGFEKFTHTLFNEAQAFLLSLRA